MKFAHENKENPHFELKQRMKMVGHKGTVIWRILGIREGLESLWYDDLTIPWKLGV